MQIVKKKGKRELQGRGRIVDGVGAEGENRAIEEMKDRHLSQIQMKSEENTPQAHFSSIHSC